MDRGAWQATVHRVTKSWTQLNTHAHTNTLVSLNPAHTFVNSSFLSLITAFVSATHFLLKLRLMYGHKLNQLEKSFLNKTGEKEIRS